MVKDPDKGDAGSGEADYRPRTLRGELQQHKALPVEECIEIGISLASALGHLHRGGLVHRDVKPSNIIFVGGVAKLADVGLVARLSDSRSMVGTEGYFAPEGTGQPRSDVFSLGKVLYECVTGQDRMNFPDVPESWCSGSDNRAAFEFMEIVLRAAESNPERRYTDTDEMLADLALLKAGKSLRYLRRVETRLKRTLQVLAFSALGIAVAGGAWFYEHDRRARVETAEATATRAQHETQRLLGESLIAEARALRQSGQAGARGKALQAVQRGRDAGAPRSELRTEAASAMALMDMDAFAPWDGVTRHGRRVTTSPDGTYLANFADGTVRLTHRDTNAAAGTVTIPPDVADIALPRGNSLLAVLLKDRRLMLWDVPANKLIWEDTLAGALHMPAFSKDGSWAVFRTEKGLVARSSSGGDAIVLAPGAPSLRYVLLAPDGKWIAALQEPVEEGEKETGLGFLIYTQLPGRMPVPEDAARVKTLVIESDIRLEGPSISADARYLAAAVSEDRLRVWEMPSLSQVAWLRGHQRSVRSTAFHPHNSCIIASSSWDGTTRLWDIPTRRELVVAGGGGEHMRLLPERGEILMRTWDGSTMRSAPLSKASALRVLMLPPQTRFGLFAGMAYSPDGRLLAASGDAGVIVWDLESGAARAARPSSEPQTWRDVRFDPSGNALYSSGRTGLFRHAISRDAAGNVVIGAPETVLEGWCGNLVWAGDKLAVGGRFTPDRKHAVQFVNPDGTATFLPSPFAADLLSNTADGRWLAAAPYGSGAAVWDLHADPPVLTSLNTNSRIAPGFAANGDTLILGGDREIRFHALNGAPPPAPLQRLDNEVVPGRSALSPDGLLVAISTGPTSVTLCHGRTLEPLLKLDSPLTPFDCVLRFSPDGKSLALAGGVSRVIIWDIAWIKEELEKLRLGW